MSKAKQLTVTEVIQFPEQAFSSGQLKELKLPMYNTKISAGFPSPADDYIESKQDLNELLVKNPVATYFLRVSGDSMINAGIHSGDVLVVDKSLEAVEGKIVIAEVDGELTVKRLSKIKGKFFLVAENPDYKPISINPESTFQIWGVVTYVIHQPQ
jgi:DNA polymerase V